MQSAVQVTMHVAHLNGRAMGSWLICRSPSSRIRQDHTSLSTVFVSQAMSRWSLALTTSHTNTHLVTSPVADVFKDIAVALKYLISTAPLKSQKTSIFFQLPPEMRLAIYEAALLDSDDSDSSETSNDSNSVNLLKTCRQVNMEAQPVISQRPKSFTSQAKLFTWIDRSQRFNLERVRTLTLQLSDIDLAPLLEQQTTARRKNMTAWSLYQAELERLEEALRGLPNLSCLTIIPPKESQSLLVKTFYRSFLARIPKRCPKLKKLELHDSKELLTETPELNEIREVTFTGPVAKSSRAVESSSSAGQSKEDGTKFDLPRNAKLDVHRKERGRVSASPPSPIERRRARASRSMSE